jgi:hypothetical protein
VITRRKGIDPGWEGHSLTKKVATSRVVGELVSVARRHGYIGRFADEGSLVNLAGDYDYLSQAYYASQDRILAGESLRPTCQEMLDAYVPPLFLEKARLAGVPVPEYYISNGYFEPPVIVDPVNPFTLKGRIVLKPGRVKSIARSLTRNFTYAICCQELPSQCRVTYFKSVVGWCAREEYHEQSRIVWEVFGIPLARVRVIKCQSGESLLSDISPLLLADLSEREINYVRERVVWDG